MRSEPPRGGGGGNPALRAARTEGGVGTAGKGARDVFFFSLAGLMNIAANLPGDFRFCGFRWSVPVETERAFFGEALVPEVSASAALLVMPSISVAASYRSDCLLFLDAVVVVQCQGGHGVVFDGNRV